MPQPPTEPETRSNNRATPPGLSPRELQVLQGMADGLTNKEIALSLGISERWCAEIAGRARAKFHAGTSSEAVAIAVALGVITPKAYEYSKLVTNRGGLLSEFERLISRITL